MPRKLKRQHKTSQHSKESPEPKISPEGKEKRLYFMDETGPVSSNTTTRGAELCGDATPGFSGMITREMATELKTLIRQVETNLLSKMADIDIKTEFKELQKTVEEMRRSTEFLNNDVEKLKIDLPELQNKFEDRCSELDRSNALMQAYVARENLVLINVPEVRGLDGKEDTKQVFLDFLEQKLEMDGNNIEIQRVHRVFSKKPAPRPIKIRLLRYTDKEKILRNANKLRGHQEVIFSDYPPKIRAARKLLLPKMKEAREQGKKVTFSRTEPDKLIIDGNIVSYDWKKLK